MNNLRLIILLSLFYMLPKTHAETSLIVKLNNGSTSGTLLSKIDKITFSGNDMLIYQQTSSVNIITISDIQNILFGINTSIPVDPKEEQTFSFYPNPAINYIQLSQPLKEKVLIQICGLDGSIKICKEISSADTRINITELPSGLYILIINNKSYKLLKK